MSNKLTLLKGYWESTPVSHEAIYHTLFARGALQHMENIMRDTMKAYQHIGNTLSKRKKVHFEMKLPHPDAFIYDEFAQDVDRNNPLLVIEHISYTLIVMHQSLYVKAKLLRMAPPFCTVLDDDDYGNSVYGIEQKTIGDWIRFAKKVKDAKWGKTKQECVVKVTVPQI